MRIYGESFSLQKPEIVTHHASVRLSIIAAFNHSNVLMEPFSLLITHYPQVHRKKVKMNMEEMQL